MSDKLTSDIELVVITPTITNPDPVVVPEYYIGQDLNIPHDPFTIDPNYY